MAAAEQQRLDLLRQKALMEAVLGEADMQAVRARAMSMVEQAASDALQVAIMHTSVVYEAKARQQERFGAGCRLLCRVAHRKQCLRMARAWRCFVARHCVFRMLSV